MPPSLLLRAFSKKQKSFFELKPRAQVNSLGDKVFLRRDGLFILLSRAKSRAAQS